MTIKECVNCPEATDHSTAECPTLRAEDLKIDTYGIGPAHGFDTSKANMVRVTHKPTGISVKRGSERSQYANRYAAQAELARLVAFSTAQPQASAAQSAPAMLRAGAAYDKDMGLEAEDRK